MATRRLEPLAWLLFSAGGVLAALALPVLVFLFGIAYPLGWLQAPSYAHVLALVKKGFYNGLRFHRAVPNFVVQVGDPQSRNMTLQEWWGRSGSGKPIGVAEITKKRTHVRGAIGMGHSGSAKDADSQFYITLRNAPELNGKYTVFGQVIKGMEVAAKLQKADILKKASVKE